MNRILEKMFLGGEWSVAIKYKNEKSFQVKQENNKEYWLADPFIFKYESKYFLFCEAYMRKTNKGVIRVFKIKDDLSLEDLGNVIEQEYHMSYPHVFNTQNGIYMIPETSGNRTIELYKCIEFPLKWKLEKILVKDIYAVDSNYFSYAGKSFLVTYIYENEKPHLEVYSVDERWNMRLLQKKEYKENTGRGAGNFIINKDSIIRPTQNQKNKYGESIYLKKCTIDQEDVYNEKIVSEICIDKICIDGKNEYKRIHTYNTIDNIEVIDVRSETIDLFLVWKKIKRRLYNNRA